MARGDIRQRISLDGGEEVRRQLQQLGKAGEDAIRAMDRAVNASTGLAKAGAALTPAVAAMDRLNAGARAVGNSVGLLASTVFPAFGSSGQLAVAGVVLGFANLVAGAARAIIELDNLSKVSGFSIETLDGLKDVFKAIVDRDDINKSVVKFADELAKARLEAGKTANEVVKGVTIMRGSLDKLSQQTGDGGVEVFHGIGRQVRDTSDAFKALNIDVSKFPKTAAGSEAALIAFSKGLSGTKDKTEQARIGVEMFGRQWAIMGAAFLDLDKTLPAAKLQNLKSGLGLTPKNIADARAYQLAVTDVGDALNDTARKLGAAFLPAASAGIRATGESFEFARDSARAFGDMVSAAADAIARGDWAGLGRGLAEIGKIDFFGVRASLEALPGTARLAAEGIRAAFAPGGLLTGVAEFDPLGMKGAILALPAQIEAVKATFTEFQAWVAAQNQAFWDGVAATATAIDANVRQVWGAMAEWVATTIGGALTGIWDQFTRAAEGAIERVRGFLNDLWSLISSIASAIAGLFSSSSSGGGGGSSSETVDFGGGGDFARGGLVRGPGTGTSDSIPAWLSNREFVNTARAVRFWGPDVFDALNRLQMPKFALGGLVDAMNTSLMPRSRGFRSGGLAAAVAGGGGVPLHLHIGGKTFVAHADALTLNGLAREARMAKLLSAGRRPGWAGG